MAKQRTVVAAVYKSKDEGGEPYVRVRKDKDVTIPAGAYLYRQSTEDRKVSVLEALKNGKMKKETAESILESLKKDEKYGKLEEIYFLTEKK